MAEIEPDAYYLSVMEWVKWSKTYLNLPDNYTCPTQDADLFHQLHNYTEPRPINAREFEHVMLTCEAR